MAFLQIDLFRELVFGQIISLHTLAYIFILIMDTGDTFLHLYFLTNLL